MSTLFASFKLELMELKSPTVAILVPHRALSAKLLAVATAASEKLLLHWCLVMVMDIQTTTSRS